VTGSFAQPTDANIHQLEPIQGKIIAPIAVNSKAVAYSVPGSKHRWRNAVAGCLSNQSINTGIKAPCATFKSELAQSM
jgi:hypothetical protein